MGNDLKKENTGIEKENFILKDDEIIDFLGKKNYYFDPTKNKYYIYIKTSYNITNKDLTENELKNLECLNNLQNSVKLLNYELKIKKLFCSEKMKLNLFFQSEKKNLFQISKSRENNQKILQKKPKISQNDVWLIIGDLLNYINDLNYYDLSNGDLQPKYMYMDENNIIKVFSPLLYTTYKNAYRFMMCNHRYKSPLSPELMYFFDFREPYPKYDKLKSDIFSLGISILCLIWGIDFEIFYDFDKAKIHFDLIFRYLKNLNDIYSEGIILFLELCLEKDIQKRASLDILFSIMNKCCKSLIFWQN